MDLRKPSPGVVNEDEEDEVYRKSFLFIFQFSQYTRLNLNEDYLLLLKSRVFRFDDGHAAVIFDKKKANMKNCGS
jgi:hypothetical protein